MAKHEIIYDEDGLSTNDPWPLQQYLTDDRFTIRDQGLIMESVLSWLREYETADCTLWDAIRELADDLEDDS